MSLDVIELEAALDHVLCCTRALRKRLQQANRTAAAIVEREDVRYRVSLLSYEIAGSRAVRSDEK
jgi:hypothetical protein